ncbi:MAG: DUF1932 domain-containing protein [Actinobacteria bacterium]|nr:DUF1932 domain-containing protein [Actinomycetota bacterium]
MLDDLGEGTLYADLSTTSPDVKVRMAELTAGRGVTFADVAMMSPVPGRGLGVPCLVSRSGAARYAELVNHRGGQVEVVGPDAGEAALRKLLRSVVMKGVAAVLMEALEAAEAADRGLWLWDHISEVFTAIDDPVLRRLVLETPTHARRRIDEMVSTAALLRDLEVPSPMTDATIARQRRLVVEGRPDLTLE